MYRQHGIGHLEADFDGQQNGSVQHQGCVTQPVGNLCFRLLDGIRPHQSCKQGGNSGYDADCDRFPESLFQQKVECY